MAGGFRARLAPLTAGFPNPLAPIGNLTFPKLQPAFGGRAAAVRILATTARLDTRLHRPAPSRRVMSGAARCSALTSARAP